MKKGLTELVFILDKSGSMSGLEKDTIGGFNSMLTKQQELNQECFITTVLFDNNYELLHDRINLKAVSPLTNKEYSIGGSTALLDAIGKTINKLISVQKHTAQEYQAEKVMMVIITDGEENSSREYSTEKIKSLIEHQKTKYGWEFIFLGANIDSVETASTIGIDADRATNYHADKVGVSVNFMAMSDVVRSVRTKGSINKDWKKDILSDYEKRKK